MNKIRDVIILLLFSLSTIQAATASSEDDENAMQEGFKRTIPLSTESQERSINVRRLPDEGSGNNGIYEITEDNQGYIGKVLKRHDKDNGGSPRMQIGAHKNLEKTIDGFNERESFPKFAKYMGTFKANDKDVILFKKADGISLRYFLRTELDRLDKEEQKQHIEKIGKVLGNFHSYEEGTWCHGDFKSGSNNIFYDIETQTLTLIDYGGLSKKEKDIYYCKKERDHVCTRILNAINGKDINLLPEEEKKFYEELRGVYLQEYTRNMSESMSKEIINKFKEFK